MTETKIKTREIPAAIILTPAAEQRIADLMAAAPDDAIGVKLSTPRRGCSGLAYVLEFVDELNADDQVFEEYGLKLIVDGKSLVYIDGTQLDFVKEGLNEGFQFKNPNVNGECGCGESFTV